MTDDQDEQLFLRAGDALRAPGARDAEALADVVAAIRREAWQRENTASEWGSARLTRARRRARLPRGTARFIAGLAAGLAFAAGLGLGAWAGWRMRGASSRVAAEAPLPGDALPVSAGSARTSLGTAVQPVQFMFVAPAATRVSLVGEFNDWDPEATPMVRAPGGTWRVALPLARGRHVYAFVVDGSSWVADPAAPLAPERWFGTSNSVVLVNGARSQ